MSIKIAARFPGTATVGEVIISPREGRTQVSTLYELTGEYLTLLEMMEDPEEDPQAVADTMEMIQGELADRADGYGKVMMQLKADSMSLQNEIERLTARKKALDANLDKVKAAMQKAMTATGQKKLKTKLFTFSIQKNPASVVIDDEKEIPVDFLVMQAPKVDKAKLKKALQDGEDLTGIAHLEQGESLRVR